MTVEHSYLQELSAVLATCKAHGWPEERSLGTWLAFRLEELDKLRLHAGVASQYAALTEEVHDLAISLGWKSDCPRTPMGQLRHVAERHLALRAELRKLVDAQGWRIGDGPAVDYLARVLDTLRDGLRESSRNSSQLLDLANYYGYMQGAGTAATPLEYISGQLAGMQRELVGSEGVRIVQEVAVNHGWPKDKPLATWLDSRLLLLARVEGLFAADGWDERVQPLATWLHTMRSATANENAALRSQLAEAQRQLGQAQATAHNAEALRARLGELLHIATDYGWQEPGTGPGMGIAAYLKDDSSASATAVQTSLGDWLRTELTAGQQAQQQVDRWHDAALVLRRRLETLVNTCTRYGLWPNSGAHDYARMLLSYEAGTLQGTALDSMRAWLLVRFKRLERAQQQIARLNQQLHEALGHSATMNECANELLDTLPVEEVDTPRTCALCGNFKTCQLRHNVGASAAEFGVHAPDVYATIAQQCHYFVDKRDSDH